jgi:dTDP-4-amino-4,6-dideoxygalactose transaminase
MSLALHGGQPAVPTGLLKSSPPVTALDEEMVLASLRSGVHTWGENCEALQREYAAWNGNRHCIAVNAGTSALHLALAGAGVAAGDEVIGPAYSWTSSASAILHHNAIPVFVDIEPTWANLDPERIEAAITPKTKAVLAVHLHGVPAQLDEIAAICRRHGLALIEDCCQSHGALYRGRKVGTIGLTSAFSLNQNKMFSAGEGGLMVTDDAAACERARSLVLFGDFRRPEGDQPEGYPGYGLAWQYRYNELCAAWARSQLTQLDAGIAHARALFALLRAELAGIPGLILPVEPEFGTENAYNFVCHVDPAAAGYDGPPNWLREAVVTALAAEGVPAGVWQRRILPEMAPIAARNAYGGGSPWRESGSTVAYDPAQFPAALYHSATYFVINGLRAPNGEELARVIAAGVRKVFEHLDQIDIAAVAQKADVSLYERGWRGQKIAL